MFLFLYDANTIITKDIPAASTDVTYYNCAITSASFKGYIILHYNSLYTYFDMSYYLRLVNFTYVSGSSEICRISNLPTQLPYIYHTGHPTIGTNASSKVIHLLDNTNIIHSSNTNYISIFFYNWYTEFDECDTLSISGSMVCCV